MHVQTVEPDANTGELLAGAQFSDAFSVVVDDAALDARHAAEKMLGGRRDGSKGCSACETAWWRRSA